MRKALEGVPNEHVRAWLRSEYERNRLHRKKIHLPYDVFVALVEDDNRSLRSIARSLGAKVQSVSALCRKYVAPLHGWIRRPVWGQAQRTIRHLNVLCSMPFIGILARRVLAAGHTVTPVMTSHGSIAKKNLLINGSHYRLQLVRAAMNARLGSGAVYACFGINLRRQEQRRAVILMAAVPGFPLRVYIVPMRIVRSLAGRRKSVVVYIPLIHRRTYHNVRPIVRWRRFEDKFNILK